MLQKNKKYFDELALRMNERGRRHRYYWDDIARQISYFLDPSASVLEVGCGRGELLAGLQAAKKTGIDYSENMISAGRRAFPDLELHTMNAESLHLDEKYDVIILSNLIGYLDDIQKVFSELHKVCHSRTKIIVTYYNFLWEPVLNLAELIGLKEKTPKQNWLSLAGINDLLALSGFRTYRSTRRMLVPVYIPLISEIMNGFVARLPLVRRLCINTFSFAVQTSEYTELNDYSVSVIIPARNESGNIAAAVQRMPLMGRSTEIIFVESNSSDDTWSEIMAVSQDKGRHKITCLQLSGGGKKEAVMAGFKRAEGEILMILDADLTVAPEDLSRFYEAIRAGRGDFINGSRLIYPTEKEAMRYLNLVGNKFFSSVFTWLLDQRISDTLCGTKVMFRNDYQRLSANRKFFGDFDPFGDFDLLFGAYKLNLVITEMPVRYYERQYGRTNISRFRHGWLLLKMCFFAARKIRFAR